MDSKNCRAASYISAKLSKCWGLSTQYFQSSGPSSRLLSNISAINNQKGFKDNSQDLTRKPPILKSAMHSSVLNHKKQRSSIENKLVSMRNKVKNRAQSFPEQEYIKLMSNKNLHLKKTGSAFSAELTARESAQTERVEKENSIHKEEKLRKAPVNTQAGYRNTFMQKLDRVDQTLGRFYEQQLRVGRAD